MKLEFEIDPVPKKASVRCRNFMVKNPRTREFEETLASMARAIYHEPASLHDLQVVYKFTMATNIKGRWGTWCSMRPDIDNLEKAANDALNGICWGDDKQIVSLASTKRWGEKGKIEVDFWPL